MPTYNVPDVGTDHESEAPSERSDSDVEFQDRPDEDNEDTMSPEPTIAQLMAAIEKLKKTVEEQQEIIDNLEDKNLVKTKQEGEIMRPEHPEKFKGDPKNLKKFLMAVRTYFEYFPRTLGESEKEARIRYAGSRLDGAARDWFEPIQKDHRDTDEANQEEQTKKVFQSYKGFEDQLIASFGTINEEKEAENELATIKQKGALSKHTVAFTQLLSKVNWTEQGKMAAYYRSLKSEVKNELSMKDRPETYAEYTQMAIKIDDRQYERRQEQKQERKEGHKNTYTANHKAKREHVASSNDGRPGRMDLDTINTRKFTGKCNHCGKTGHKEKDCWNKHGKPNTPRKPTEKTKETEKIRVDTIETVPHDLLSWTACYDDQCLVHKSGKEGSGWFPQAPKRKQPKKVTIATMTFKETDEISSLIDDIPVIITAPEPTEEEKENERRILFEMQERNKETGHADLDISEPCGNCGSREPQGPNHPCGWNNSDNDEDLIKEEPENELQRLLSHEGIVRRQAPKNDGLAERANANPYYPILTRAQFLEWEEAQLMHDTPFTENCGHSSIHQCNKHLCSEHWETKIIDWHSWIQHGNLYDRNCTHVDPEQCPSRLCNQHVEYKVEEWHVRRETIACKKHHPLQCYNDECLKHQTEKEEYKNLRRRLRKQGFNFETHDKGHAYRKDIIRFHEFHLEEITTHKCQWCRKVTKTNQVKQWRDNDLDAIHEDALTYNITKEDREKVHVDTVKTTGMKKLRINARLFNSAITAYIDSGSDRNLISTQTIEKLQIPVQRKVRALQVMSVMGTEVGDGLIEYETDHLPLTINGRTHTVQLSVLDMPNCDILLGYPWLIDNDPIIRWKTNQVCWDIKDVPEY